MLFMQVQNRISLRTLTVGEDQLIFVSSILGLLPSPYLALIVYRLYCYLYPSKKQKSLFFQCFILQCIALC